MPRPRNLDQDFYRQNFKLLAKNETNSKTKGVVLSTAHPGKFADVIEPIIGNKTALPESLQIAMKKEKNSIKMPKQFSDLKEYLLAV